MIIRIIEKQYEHSVWVYFDEFYQVRTIEKTYEELVKKSQNISDYDYCSVIHDKDGYSLDGILIIGQTDKVKSKRWFGYQIITNQKAYLLNNEGKTIKRLN